MKASLTTDLNQLKKMIRNQREVQYVTMKAANSWLFATNKYLKKEIDKYLEGGAERFTKSGLRVQKVKSKRILYGNLHLSLQAKKPYLDRYYLKNIVFGGKVLPPRPDRKKLMQPIPGKVRLNAKGNLTKGKFATLRSQENKYFYGIPKGMTGERYRGLWKRTGRGKNKKLQMIIALGKESRMQEALFPAPRLASRRFQKKFGLFFAAEYNKMLRRNR